MPWLDFGEIFWEISVNKRKRVLVVSPFLPYPPNQGGIARIYNLLKFLSANYDLYLLSFVQEEKQVLYFLELKKFCKEIYPVLHLTDSSFSNPELSRLCPLEVKHFYSSEIGTLLNEIIKTECIDLVQIEYIFMANYVNSISGVPVIFTEHDTSHFSFERSIHYREFNEKERFTNWQKLVNFEIGICHKFSRIIVLTKEDKEQLTLALPYAANISVVPTGVDTGFFRPASPKSVKAPKPGSDNNCSPMSYNLIYVGHYLHYPNQDAMLYFYEKIFPSVAQRIPEVKLYLVGSSPTAEILKLAKDPRVTVTGEVPDLRPYHQKGDVFIAPLRVGGGIKGKILEAMAMGVPVVANKLGASGIEATPGKEIIIAEEPEEFAEKTVELLKEKKLRKKIAGNARKFVEQKYDWQIIVPELSQIYEETIAEFKKRT